MKLVYIANLDVPSTKASGYQISKMCEEFGLSGIDVELWIPDRTGGVYKDLFDFYQLERSFTVKRIKSFNFFKFYKYIKKISFWLQTVVFLFTLLFIKVDKNTIIYSRSPEIIWLFNLKKYKTVFEIHRLPETKRRLFTFFVKKTNHIITVTEGLKNLYLTKIFSDQKVLVSPDGVDMDIFDIDLSKERARDILGLLSHKKIIGYFGRFRTMGMGKGIEDILSALKNLDDNIMFVCVGGDSAGVAYYKEKVRDAGLSDRVVLLESVSRNKLAQYQKACDALLMPFPNTKHYAYYMSPLKMFEYISYPFFCYI